MFDFLNFLSGSPFDKKSLAKEDPPNSHPSWPSGPAPDMFGLNPRSFQGAAPSPEQAVDVFRGYTDDLGSYDVRKTGDGTNTDLVMNESGPGRRSVETVSRTDADPENWTEQRRLAELAGGKGRVESTSSAAWHDADGGKNSETRRAGAEASLDGVAASGGADRSRVAGDETTRSGHDWSLARTDGKTSAELASSRSHTDGITTRGTDAEVGYGEKGAYGKYETHREIKADDDHILTDRKRFEVGGGQVALETGSGSRLEDADMTGVVVSEDKSNRLAFGNGFEATRSQNEVTEVGGEKFSKGSITGVKDGQAVHGINRAHERKDDAGNTIVNTSGTQMGANLDGGSIGRTTGETITDADGKVIGSKSTAYGADVNLAEGTVGGNFAHNTTDADGNTTGYAVNGKGGFDDDGTLNKLDVGMGVSRNGKSVSVNAGFEVHAEDPVEVNGAWVVAWMRTVHAGAAASAGKIGGHASKNSADYGRRIFKTKAEADAFCKHAASMIPVDQPDPTSVQGALMLQVGEARGASSGSEMGVEGSVPIGGVGGINAGASTSSQSGATVERVGDSTFLVTIDSSETDGTNYGLSLSQASISNSESDTSSNKMTVKFDLSTEQGKRAFEEFNRSHKPPKVGGQIVSQTDAQKHREGTTIKIGSLGSAAITSTTSESVTYDQSGKTEVYEGEFGWEVDEIDLPFIGGDGDIKAASRIVETEVNDETRAHILSAFVECEDGDDSREQLAKLTGMGDHDEGKETSSGKWSVSARISDEQLQEFIERFEGHEERDEDIFGGGSDARNQLTKKLHRAKTMDDKLRAVAWFVAHDDLDRKNLGDMREVLFGNDWGGAEQNFDYDVLLKDDKGKVDRNFAGAGGRAELDSKVERFQNLMQGSGASGQATLFDSLDAEVKDLQRRKTEVSDPSRYTDLPSELRRQQVMQIDAYLATFISMRRQAGMEASKLRPGEDYNSEEDKKLLSADDADGDMDPKFREVRKLRSEIARADFHIDSSQGFYIEGTKELTRMLRDPDWYGSHRLTASRGNHKTAEARTISEGAAAMMPSIEELRASFLRVSSNPEAAIPTAQLLLGQLRSVQGMYESAEQIISTATSDAQSAPEERADGIIVNGEWYESWADVKAGKKGVTDMAQLKAPEDEPEHEGELIDVGGRKVRVIDEYDEGVSMRLPD